MSSGLGRLSCRVRHQWDEIVALSQKEEVLLNCVDPEDEARMKAEVDAVLRTGDTVGGVFEVVVHNLPPGIGTHAQLGRTPRRSACPGGHEPSGGQSGRDRTRCYCSRILGSTVHDAIGYGGGTEEDFTKFSREHNNAGGIEGGISNGKDVVVRGYLKPISTLRRPLGSVSFETREPVKAAL